MFAEVTMSNGNVNHGSWKTTSLLSLLVASNKWCFERYRGLRFLRSEENRAPNALQAFDNLPLKLWSLQMTSIIMWNDHEIWGWYVRVCQGRFVYKPVKMWHKPPEAGMTWSETFSRDTALQDSSCLCTVPPSHVHSHDIFRVRQASQIKETSFTSLLSDPFCSIVAQAVMLVQLKG